MSHKMIDNLYSQCPEFFETSKFDGDLIDDNYVSIDIRSPDKPYIIGDNMVDDFYDESNEAQQLEELYEPNPNFNPEHLPEPHPVLIDSFTGGQTHTQFPGSPVMPTPTHHPTVDAMAFYLPFHRFPNWWGIYLVHEWVTWFADYIYHRSRSSVNARDCYSAARMYLYYHEHYHHRVESFATRLEITHRRALYTKSFHSLYQASLGTSSSTEESLAEANAYLQTMKQFNKASWNTKTGLELALEHFIKFSPPGYKEGILYLSPKKHKAKEQEFAEDNLQAGVHGYVRKNPVIWSSAAYMFRGIASRSSPCKYLIRRSASILSRSPLAKPRFSGRQFLKKLRKLGCKLVRHGSKHDQWEGPNGKKTFVPRHSTEMKTGTISSILKAFGLTMEQLQTA